MGTEQQQNNWRTIRLDQLREAAAFPWFLIHTRPCSEHVVLAKLQAASVGCFLPLITRKRATGRPCALFPSYLFATFRRELHRDINELLSRLPLLGRVVYFSGEPAIVPPEVIEDVVSRLDGSGYFAAPKSDGKFLKGDHVRVTSGLLAGLDGEFEKLSGSDRAQILLNTVAHYADGVSCNRELRDLSGGAFRATVNLRDLALNT